MRVLDSGHVRGFLTASRMERRQARRLQVPLHESDGLQLSRVPVLRHYHLPRPADRGLLRPHISRDRKAGQSREGASASGELRREE